MFKTILAASIAITIRRADGVQLGEPDHIAMALA